MRKIHFNNSIETYTISLMSIFKDIFVKTYINDKENYYNVPLVYGDYNKYSIARKYIEEKGSNILSNYEMVPISAFRLTGLQFAPDRDTINTVTYGIARSEELDKNFKFRLPIPVDYTFNYTIWVRTFNQMGQILEQIYPYIVRPFSTNLKDFVNIEGIDRQPIIELQSDTITINHNDGQDNTNADNYKDIEISFDLVLKGVMHFPIKSNVGQIEKITVEIADEEKTVASNNSEGLSEYMDILEMNRINAFKEMGATVNYGEEANTLNYINVEDFKD